MFSCDYYIKNESYFLYFFLFIFNNSYCIIIFIGIGLVWHLRFVSCFSKMIKQGEYSMAKKRDKKQYRKILISWSGENSKAIARELKNTLENNIFEKTGLECFVSDLDIRSGEDWWKRIHAEVNKSSLGIVCITKENINAPWIYFEAGAIIARGLTVIPLLINCDNGVLRDTPLSSNQSVNFYDLKTFNTMIRTINDSLSLVNLSNSNLEAIARKGYEKLKTALKTTLDELKAMRVFNINYTYPTEVRNISINTLYISAPMSSIQEDEYYRLRNYLISIKSKLQEIGFTDIICPLFDNSDYNHFEGSTTAIINNFKNLKRVDSMLVICPNNGTSSVLVEIGYGLALCKKTVIFHKESLPFILEDAGMNIAHIFTRPYSTYDDITNILDKDGKQLFRINEGE